MSGERRESATKVSRKKDEKIDKAAMVQDIAQQFENSEAIAQGFGLVIAEFEAAPLEVCFAALLIDRIYTKRTPEWAKIKKWADETWKKMDAEGILPKIGEDDN